VNVDESHRIVTCVHLNSTSVRQPALRSSTLPSPPSKNWILTCSKKTANVDYFYSGPSETELNPRRLGEVHCAFVLDRLLLITSLSLHQFVSGSASNCQGSWSSHYMRWRLMMVMQLLSTIVIGVDCALPPREGVYSHVATASSVTGVSASSDLNCGTLSQTSLGVTSALIVSNVVWKRFWRWLRPGA